MNLILSKWYFLNIGRSQVEAAPDGPKNIFWLLAAAFNGPVTIFILKTSLLQDLDAKYPEAGCSHIFFESKWVWLSWVLVAQKLNELTHTFSISLYSMSHIWLHPYSSYGFLGLTWERIMQLYWIQTIISKVVANL